MQSLQWVVFEPGTPALFSAVTVQFSGFLQELWSEGGLQGDTSSQAYFVTCDTTNNPVSQLQLGLMEYEIGLALVQPASFLLLSGSSVIASSD